MGIGHWALGFGLWALGFGLWALGIGLWALGFGRANNAPGSPRGFVTRQARKAARRSADGLQMPRACPGDSLRNKLEKKLGDRPTAFKCPGLAPGIRYATS
jgi:hypothetical protein